MGTKAPHFTKAYALGHTLGAGKENPLTKSVNMGVISLNFTWLILKVLYRSFVVSGCEEKLTSGDIPDCDQTHLP